MSSNKSLIAQELRKIKDAHGITNEAWAAKAGIPLSTLNRYLSSSLNIPNFPYTCALLRVLDEPIGEFYDHIAGKISTPVEALKLDAVPTAVIGDFQMDVPENKAAVQERIIVQAEEMQAQMATIREKESQIELLETRIEMYERLLEEKERILEKEESISKARLEALKTLCSAQ